MSNTRSTVFRRREGSWYVRGYYADTVALPKRCGELAIEVSGVNREALALDIEVLTERQDIGEVVVGQWSNYVARCAWSCDEH